MNRAVDGQKFRKGFIGLKIAGMTTLRNKSTLVEQRRALQLPWGYIDYIMADQMEDHMKPNDYSFLCCCSSITSKLVIAFIIHIHVSINIWTALMKPEGCTRTMF